MKKILFVVLSLFALSWAQQGQDRPDKEATQNVDDVLGTIPDNENAAEAMEEALLYGSDRVKVKAIESLAMKAKPSHYELFSTYLGYGTRIRVVNQNRNQDFSWDIRANSAVGLARIGDPKASGILRKALFVEENSAVLRAIVYAMGEIKDEANVIHITRLIEESSDETVVLESVIALGKIGSKESFLTLLEVSTDKRHFPQTREEAIKSLENINWN